MTRYSFVKESGISDTTRANLKYILSGGLGGGIYAAGESLTDRELEPKQNVVRALNLKAIEMNRRGQRRRSIKCLQVGNKISKMNDVQYTSYARRHKIIKGVAYGFATGIAMAVVSTVTDYLVDKGIDKAIPVTQTD